MLSTYLKREGYRVTAAGDGQEADRLLKSESFDAMVTDLSMPGITGLQLLGLAAQAAPEMPVIVMSAYGSSDSALEAMRAGAFDYVFKPFQPDEILFSLKKAEAHVSLTRENQALKRAVGQAAEDGLIYKSRSMSDIVRLIAQFAETDSPVLITGESGTGKELVARAIHRASGRRSGPFVPVNCGAVAESLLESELFGHLRGAFTGAARQREGLFRAADTGTLFLDEIGELPVNFQVKLLRVIQFSEVTPVGGEIPVKFNARLVTATSRELEAMVRDHLFREDLYYRINVLPLHLPPLRERREDIPLLADYFAERFSSRLGRPRPTLSDDFLESIANYNWPGNIRELENLMDRLLVMAGSRESITSADLPPQFGAAVAARRDLSPDSLDLKTATKKLEADYIRAALGSARGNRSEAARRLGLSYPSLLSKIKQYGIEVDEDRGAGRPA